MDEAHVTESLERRNRGVNFFREKLLDSFYEKDGLLFFFSLFFFFSKRALRIPDENN